MAKKTAGTKKGTKKTAGRKKAATKKAATKKAAKPAAADATDDLAAPPKRVASSKGKISIIRRAFKEGAEKGIGFSRTVWSDVWDKRVLRDFSLKGGNKTSAVILTDPSPIALHRIVYGWKSGGDNAFPKREFVRCIAVEFDEEGHLVETGKTCPVCTFFGKPSGIALIFAIGDIRRQYDKAGLEIPWAVKRILLNNFTVRDAIIQAVELAAARERREEDIAGSVFQVSRGQGKKTVRIGDVWVYERFANVGGATFQKMLANVPSWEDEYPYLDEAILKTMCQLHMKVGADHALDASDAWDSDGAQELFGSDAGAASKTADKTPAADDDDLMGPSANSEGGPSLSDMDDIPEEGGEEEEGGTEEAGGGEEEVEVEVGTVVTFEDKEEGTLQGVIASIDGDVYVVDVEDSGEVYEYKKSIEELSVIVDDEDDDLPFPEEDL
jgi:hypothetical protein